MTQYARNDEASTASSLSAIAVALSQLAITQAAILERLPAPLAKADGSIGTGTNVVENVISAAVVATIPLGAGTSDVQDSESSAVPASPGTVESAVVADAIPPQPFEILVISDSESDFEPGSESESDVSAASSDLSESTVAAATAHSQALQNSVSLESEDNVEAAVTSASGAPPSYPSSATGVPPSYPGSSAPGMPGAVVAPHITATVPPITSGDVHHSDSDPDSEDEPEVFLAPPTPDEVADSLIGLQPPPDGKWYVVTAGKAPGIYSDWDETATYVNKVSGAVFKKFPTKMDALWAYKRAYIAGRARVIL